MLIDKLSLYIVAMNEERRLPRVLDSVRSIIGPDDEVVIVDSGSTDRTEEIALSYGARFIHNDWESIGHQVKFAERQCVNRWVMRLDADEVIPPELAQEINQARRNGGRDGYFFRIGEMFPGMKRPNRWVKHYNLIRLYDREAFSMSGRLGHDDVIRLRRDAKTGQMKNFVCHYSYMTLHRLVDKRNVATDRQVDRALQEGKNYSPWRMLGTMSLNFLKYYFLARYFLLGWWGFMHSINVGYMRFMKFSKFYESKQLEKHGYLDQPPKRGENDLA